MDLSSLTTDQKVGGSNPLTHANNLDRKSLVLEGFRFFVVKKLLLTFVDIF